MSDLVWTITAPYLRCSDCRHPGPPEPVASMTISQRRDADRFHLTPHHRGCSLPARFDAAVATIHFDDQSKVETA